MNLVCCAGAQNSGGAVFAGNAGAAVPDVDGGKMVLVGDTAVCPSHSPSPITTMVMPNGGTEFVNGAEIATVGGPTSCGHSLSSAGTNTKVYA